MPEKNTALYLGPLLLKHKLSKKFPVDKGSCIKKIKFDNTIGSLDTILWLDLPLGIKWMNNSCAYNVIFVVLFNIWHENLASASTLWHEL